MSVENHTPGPWHAARLVDDDGNAHCAEAIGEYVAQAVERSAQDSGTTDFLFVWQSGGGDGHVDVCHVGNGPRRLENAHLIAAAPDLLAACGAALDWLDVACDPDNEHASPEGIAARSQIEAAIAKAKGVGE